MSTTERKFIKISLSYFLPVKHLLSKGFPQKGFPKNEEKLSRKEEYTAESQLYETHICTSNWWSHPE